MLLLFVKVNFGQTNYYSFNSDSLFSELSLRLAFEKMVKTLPDNYILEPTIYHRIVKKDSIINYFLFAAQKCDSGIDKYKFKFTFNQDSLFLLLNEKLPEFKLKDLNGNEFSSSQLIGKPTLINFWETYCAPCVAEFPQLNELKEKYGNEMGFIAI